MTPVRQSSVDTATSRQRPSETWKIDARDAGYLARCAEWNADATASRSWPYLKGGGPRRRQIFKLTADTCTAKISLMGSIPGQKLAEGRSDHSSAAPT